MKTGVFCFFLCRVVGRLSTAPQSADVGGQRVRAPAAAAHHQATSRAARPAVLQRAWLRPGVRLLRLLAVLGEVVRPSAAELEVLPWWEAGWRPV